MATGLSFTTVKPVKIRDMTDEPLEIHVIACWVMLFLSQVALTQHSVHNKLQQKLLLIWWIDPAPESNPMLGKKTNNKIKSCA